MQGLSPVVASGGHSSLRCAGLSLSQPLLLRSTSSRCAGSVVVAHGPSCSAACGIFPDQGSNPCPLHWQTDSQPLRHQGSPTYAFLRSEFKQGGKKEKTRAEIFVGRWAAKDEDRKELQIQRQAFTQFVLLFATLYFSQLPP